MCELFLILFHTLYELSHGSEIGLKINRHNCVVVAPFKNQQPLRFIGPMIVKKIEIFGLVTDEVLLVIAGVMAVPGCGSAFIQATNQDEK